MKYLTTPCPRCHAKKLEQPVKHATADRWYSCCAGCGLKSLAQIRIVGGKTFFKIRPIGKNKKDIVRMTFDVEIRLSEILRALPPRSMSAEINLALDKHFKIK